MNKDKIVNDTLQSDSVKISYVELKHFLKMDKENEVYKKMFIHMEEQFKYQAEHLKYVVYRHNDIVKMHQQDTKYIATLNKKIARRKRNLPYIIGAAVVSGFILNSLTR